MESHDLNELFSTEMDLHSFFKHTSARKDDYANFQFDMDIVEHVFMRYVQTKGVRDLARDLD